MQNRYRHLFPSVFFFFRKWRLSLIKWRWLIIYGNILISDSAGKEKDISKVGFSYLFHTMNMPTIIQTHSETCSSCDNEDGGFVLLKLKKVRKLQIINILATTRYQKHYKRKDLESYFADKRKMGQKHTAPHMALSDQQTSHYCLICTTAICNHFALHRSFFIIIFNYWYYRSIRRLSNWTKRVQTLREKKENLDKVIRWP